MEKNKKKDSYSTSDDTLQDVSGGYVRKVKGSNDTIGVFDNKTNELIFSARESGDRDVDREVFRSLTQSDIDYHSRKK